MNIGYYFIKVNQNIDFNMYIGKINIIDLYEIHEVEAINEDIEKNNMENPKQFLNDGLLVQRNEKIDKILGISNYVSNSVIPNSIILGNEKGKKGVMFHEQENGLFKLVFKDNLNIDDKLFVIDGQHRLKGAALNVYNNILEILKDKYANNKDKDKYDILKKISLSKTYTEKIKKIKDFIKKNSLENVYNDVNILEFSVVILDNLTSNKIVEIFTDINSSQKPLDSNIYRYYYGRFTTKFPYLNVSVNIAKLLNEHKDSPLHGLIKMPYIVRYYNENLKGHSRVGVGAFCERFNGVSEIKNISNLEEIKFSNKVLGIFINHNLFIGKDKISISDDSIVNSIKFLFTFMIYVYKEIYNLYLDGLESEKISELEIKNYKFIDSTSNELYFNVIKILLMLTISDYNYDIEQIFGLGNNDIKKSISRNFSKINSGLLHVFSNNKYFKKGQNTGTGWAKSRYIINEFQEKLDFINEEFIANFDFNIRKYYINFKGTS